MCFSTRRRNSWKAGLWKVWHAITVQRVPGCEDFLNLTYKKLSKSQQIIIHGFAKSSLTLSLATCSLEIVLTWLCYYVVIVWLSAGLFLLSLFWTQPPPPRKLGDLCRLNIFSLSFVKYTWIFFLIATDSSLSQTIRFVFSTHFRNEKSELLVFVQNANFCFLLAVIDCFLFLMF